MEQCSSQNGKSVLSLNQKIAKFRPLQLLTQNSESLILPIIISPIFICAFALITIAKSSNMDMLLAILIITLVNCWLAILLIEGQMAMVYGKSCRMIEIMKEKANSQTTMFLQILNRKFYKSCQPLKIVMGSANIIDSSTLLHCLEHSLNLSLQVLLLTSKKPKYS